MMILSILIISIALLSCTRKGDENEVYIYKDTYFKLGKDEKLIDLTRETTDLYFTYINNVDLQIPLFRLVQGEGYRIYIGLPINIKVRTLKNYEITDEIDDKNMVTDGKTYLYNSYIKEDVRITKYYEDFNGDIALLMAVTPANSEKRFSYKSMVARFVRD